MTPRGVSPGEPRPPAASPVRRALDLWRREGMRALVGRVRHHLRGSRADNDLMSGLDMPLPDTLVVGEGTVLVLTGWCFHPRSRITRARIVVNGVAHAVADTRLPRPDVCAGHFPDRDPKGHSYASGFVAHIPFSGDESNLRVELQLQARLRDGTRSSRALGTVELVARAPATRPDHEGPAPRVAICMATFNPPVDLFRRQVESIRAQTMDDWTCVISDDGSDAEAFEAICRIAGEDPRFRVSRAPARVGFYGNFERCLSLVPEGTEFVALSDQDDRWHPEKLETLLAAFQPDTTLVYSDMNIIDEKGQLLSGTYWTTRPNRYDDLGSLLMANTVTGAASMFRGALLRRLLPFPQRMGQAFHDHWIACLALALGRVDYVDRPLYDYVQHSSNVLGHFAPAQVTAWSEARRLAQALSSGQPAARLRSTLAHWGSVYLGELQKVKLMARLLELRCAGALTPKKARALRRLARLGESWSSTAWLAGREAKGTGRPRATLRAEYVLLKGLLWRRYGRLWRDSAPRSGNRPAPGGAPPKGVVRSLEQVQRIEQKIAPLRLRVSQAAPARVNLLIPTIDFTYFFGGYIAKFNLARRLAEQGHRVRIVAVDYCPDRMSAWKEQVRAFEGLDGVFDRVEVALAADREQALEVSPHDAFIATTWWTAHIAHRAVETMGGSRFLYLVQEYEPFTFPMGTLSALARESYDFPHLALFSTELLRDYFRQNRIGVFAPGNEAGERDSLSFQNAITPVGVVTVGDIANRRPRQLLFYARPEAHAARNMFELGVLGLSRAIAEGAFQDGWEFHGLGAVSEAGLLPLGSGAFMHVEPRRTQEEYRHFLRRHDVGLSLMYTPHPSLVPIEMASAGMLVVTNSFENKTADSLRAISGNFIVESPTVDGVARGLRQAAAVITDYERRVEGSRVRWSTRWDESLDERVMKRVNEFLGRPSGSAATS